MQPSTNDPEAQELKTSLDQALSCTACTPAPAPASASVLTTPTSVPGPGIPHTPPTSPFDTTPKPPDPDYSSLMTEAQETRFLERVLEYVTAEYHRRNRPMANGEPGGECGRRIDVDALLARAVRQVEDHVYRHYRAGRGMLGFCRDVEDVVALRRWVGILSAGDGEDDNEDTSGDRRPRKRRKGVGGIYWPQNGPEMVDQTAIWRRGWRERAERVDRARVRWMWVMDARRDSKSEQKSTSR